LNFFAALETLVEIANMQSSLLYSFRQLQKVEDTKEWKVPYQLFLVRLYNLIDSEHFPHCAAYILTLVNGWLHIRRGKGNWCTNSLGHDPYLQFLWSEVIL